MELLRTHAQARTQAGVTLLEVLVSLGIMATVVVGVAGMVNQRTEDTKAAVTAQHIKTIGTAASEYIKANYTTVQANATATKPALIRVADLIAGGYLQAGFNAQNAYGQSTCVLALKSATNNLTTMVVAEGGNVVDDLSLGQIASLIGAAGGGIYSTSAGTLRGAMGGWSMAPGNLASANHLGQNCSGAGGAVQFTAGHPLMALWFADGQDVSATLYRDAVPGNPSLNTMNTPILMGAGATVTENAACASVGAIARDGGGKMMTCQGGAWKGSGGGSLTWKGWLAGVGNLPYTGNTAGDTYRISGLANHAFTWDAINNVWQGLTLEADGHLRLPGVIFANGSSSNYGAITLHGQKNGWGGINFKDSGGGNLGTLMMNSANAGFYNSQDNAWRFVVDNAGNATIPGNATANSLTVGGGGSTNYGGSVQHGWATHYSGTSTVHDDWALTTYGGGVDHNVQPRSSRASIYTNDVYLRSAGRWASDSSVDILEGPHYIAGLKPGKKYLVSVYGITANRTKNDATLLPVQVRNSWGGVIGQSGPGLWINWHDGSAPQSATIMIYAPPDGVVYGFTDIGPAYYMTAIGG